ncbi:MAG TPA: hypothetical protein DCE42_15980 [Myxococcales bacterium]|nr:hypothetical protein [Myxococcales bacterium]
MSVQQMRNESLNNASEITGNVENAEPTLEKIGLIGDVHGEDKRLERALKCLAEQDVDDILCTGDIVDGTHSVDRCFELLEQYQVYTVRGNHDRWYLENRMRDLPNATLGLQPHSKQYLDEMKPTLTFDTQRGSLLLCHGIGENDMALLKPDDIGYALNSNIDLEQLLASRKYGLIVGGHTHLPMVRNFGVTLFINPGCLCSTKSSAFSVLDLTNNSITNFSFEGEDTLTSFTRDLDLSLI